MTPSKATPVSRTIVRTSVFVAVVLAVFLVPFAFPPAKGISMSYRVGFNNHVALLTLLAGTLAFALWTRGWGMRLGSVERRVRMGRPATLVVGVAVVLPGLLAVAMGLRAAWAGPAGESNYFLDRLAMVSLGYVPFRTMTFDYGPLMFYPTVWVHGLTRLTMGDSYVLCWAAAWMLGTALLWDTVRRLTGPAAHRLGVFLVLFALWLPSILSGGLNYTPLRYALAPWFAVRVWQVQARSVPHALLLAFAGFVVALLYSPEQGISLLLATLLFFAVCVRGRAMVLPLLAFAVASGATLLLAKHLGLLQTMFDFGGGGYDFPLLLNTRTLTMIALLVLAGCVVVRSLIDGAANRPEVYLVAVALGLLPSALGRADAGHLLVNTVPALTVALLVLWRTPAVRVPAMILSVALAVAATWTQTLPGLYGVFGPHLALHLRQMLHRPGSADTDATAAERAGLEQLLQGSGQTNVLAPLSYLQPATQAVPLPIATGRFFGFGLVSERFVQAKLDEIEQRDDRYLLLPVGYKGFCWTPDAPYIRGVLRDVLQPWYVPMVKHTGNAAMPMCLYLRAHYAPAALPPPEPGYVLVERLKSDGSSR